jgi:L-fuconolactonase
MIREVAAYSHRTKCLAVFTSVLVSLISASTTWADEPIGELPTVKHLIDTHIHLYDTERENGVPWPPESDEVLYKPHLPEEFAKAAKPAGVTGVVIVEASDRLEDNQWVLDQVKDQKDFFIALVGNIDPTTDKFAEQLEQMRKDKRFVGIRGRVRGRKLDHLDPQVLTNYRLLAKAGLSLDILMNGEGPEAIREVDQLAQKIPNLRIIVNHVLGYNIDGKPPGEEWVSAAKSLAENPNVYVKVSGLYQRCTIQPASQDPAHYKALLDILWENFGSDHLIYGSNWPCTKKSGDYASFVRLTNAYFSEKGQEASEKYYWKNAAAAYKLSGLGE